MAKIVDAGKINVPLGNAEIEATGQAYFDWLKTQGTFLPEILVMQYTPGDQRKKYLWTRLKILVDTHGPSVLASIRTELKRQRKRAKQQVKLSKGLDKQQWSYLFRVALPFTINFVESFSLAYSLDFGVGDQPGKPFSVSKLKVKSKAAKHLKTLFEFLDEMKEKDLPVNIRADVRKYIEASGLVDDAEKIVQGACNAMKKLDYWHGEFKSVLWAHAEYRDLVLSELK